MFFYVYYEYFDVIADSDVEMLQITRSQCNH